MLWFVFCAMYIRATIPLCRHLTDKARLLLVDSFSLHSCCRRLAISAVNCGVVDMRSDVLAKPTPRMLQAMTQASLDDDVFREDQTTRGNWHLDPWLLLKTDHWLYARIDENFPRIYVIISRSQVLLAEPLCIDYTQSCFYLLILAS